MAEAFAHVYALIIFLCCSFHHLNWAKGFSSDRCSHPYLLLHTEHRGLCFGVDRFFVSWTKARKYCEEERTRLAKITQEMFKGPDGEVFSKTLYEDLMRKCGSIGLFFNKNVGEWRWIDGTEFDSSELAPGARGQKDHDCMEICPLNNGNAWKYQPAFCFKEVGTPYVCQYEVSREVAESTTTTEEQGVVTTEAEGFRSHLFTVTYSVTESSETNTMITPRRKWTRKRKPLTERRRDRSTVYRKEGTSMDPEGGNLWEMVGYAVTMCIRFCMADENCGKIAFKVSRRKCLGFPPKHSITIMISREGWEIWGLADVEVKSFSSNQSASAIF